MQLCMGTDKEIGQDAPRPASSARPAPIGVGPIERRRPKSNVSPKI